MIAPAYEVPEWTEKISLQELPYRENKMTRIRIELELLDENTARIICMDLGFGKFVKESKIKITKEILLEKIEEVEEKEQGGEGESR